MSSALRLLPLCEETENILFFLECTFPNSTFKVDRTTDQSTDSNRADGESREKRSLFSIRVGLLCSIALLLPVLLCAATCLLLAHLHLLAHADHVPLHLHDSDESDGSADEEALQEEQQALDESEESSAEGDASDSEEEGETEESATEESAGSSRESEGDQK